MDNMPIKSSIDRTAQCVIQYNRRAILSAAGVGLGAIALESMMAQDTPKPLGMLPGFHVPPRIKNVIFLFMAGGPSQLELFEDKPVLREYHGKLPPESLTNGRRFAFLPADAKLLGSNRKFERYGQCGMELSSLLPHHQKIVDKVCWLRGM